MCGSCGAEAPKGARFCGACGVRLITDPDAAEYKHVTVLFADVERSMDIAAALDIERLREVMTELVERSTTVLRRYGGTVEYNGDGVMALFGAPVALEDHAFRACMAALEVQGEASQLAAEVKQRDGIDFRVRVGLNSGRVIAGEIGSGAFGYRAIGETVGFAQRMESVAPAGGVMLSESTARLVEDLVTLGERDQVRVKGADQPVAVRQLLGITPRSGRDGAPRIQAGRSERGNGRHRGGPRFCNRQPRRRPERRGAAGNRKVPGGPGGGGAGGGARSRRDLGLLRVACPRHLVRGDRAVVASGHRRRGPRR